MVTFETKVAGIPCQCQVTSTTPYIPATFWEPAEGGDFEFNILDRKGYRAKWLEAKLTSADYDRLYNEYEQQEAEY